MKQKIICVDFDGTIHSYASGWKGACEIPDPPIEGALEWLTTVIDDDRFEVNIYSSRSKEEGAVDAMKAWFAKWLIEYYRGHIDDEDLAHAANHYVSMMKFPTQKPPAFLTVDDRAICFEGHYPSVEEMNNFLTWQKKPNQSYRLKAYLAVEKIVMDADDSHAECSDSEQLRDVVLDPIWYALTDDERAYLSARPKVR